MLTRLKVNGFKNLVDVDVRFGPFTCIAGVNGSGKSNLFDAIRFLAALAEKPLVEAALSVRGGSRSADIRDLFHRVGDQYADEMSFEAEMIIPSEGSNAFGAPVISTSTYFRYQLILKYLGPSARVPIGIIHERLAPISVDDTSSSLAFAPSQEWIESAVHLDETEIEQEYFFASGERYRTRASRSADIIDREGSLHTHISMATANVYPAMILARQEMRSWRVLQFDPIAMRKPDDLITPPQLGDDGSHLAATLYNIAQTPSSNGTDPEAAESAVYGRVRIRLFQLIGEMREIVVERDDKREELTLFATGQDGTTLPARALSDGTLRFLALAVLEQQEEPGLYCIEEPENGIHPGRIESLIKLLQAIAMDTSYPIEEGNPLRQVIISTHSPSVVMRVPANDLVIAELRESHDERGRFKRSRFSGLVNTWRDPSPGRTSVALWTLLDYLSPEGYRPLPEPDPDDESGAAPRTMDHPRIREMLSPVSRLND